MRVLIVMVWDLFGGLVIGSSASIWLEIFIEVFPRICAIIILYTVHCKFTLYTWIQYSHIEIQIVIEYFTFCVVAICILLLSYESSSRQSLLNFYTLCLAVVLRSCCCFNSGGLYFLHNNIYLSIMLNFSLNFRSAFK